MDGFDKGFDKRRAVVRTKRTWLFVAQLAPAAAFIGLVPRLLPDAAAYFGVGGIALTIVVLLGQSWQRWLRVRSVDVRADAAGVYLGGGLAAGRTAILRAHFLRDRGTTFVRVVRRLRPLEIFVEDEQEGRRLIAALRLDPAHSVVRLGLSEGDVAQGFVRVGVLSLGWAVGWLVSMMLFFMAGTLFGLAALSVPVACAILFARGQLTLSVGADGVHIRRCLGVARFIRYADIKHLTTRGPTLSLELQDGSTLTMSHGVGARARWLIGSEVQDDADALFSRVSAHVEHHRASARASSAHASLARGSRPAEEWLRELRVRSEASATWRVAAIPEAVLWTIVEDSTAPPTSRVGAAVALWGGLDATGTARLRVAAQACAAPRVRVALEAAARPDDESALTAALDALDDNLPQPSGHRHALGR